MTAGATLTVVARWQVAAGAIDEVLPLLDPLRQASLAEPGCLAYDVFRSVASPDELMLLECYVDTAAFDAHRATAHFQDLVVGRIVPLLADREVRLLTAFAAS